MNDYKLNKIEVCPHCAQMVAKGGLKKHKCPDSKPMNTWRQKNLAKKEEEEIRSKASDLGVEISKTDSVKSLKEKIEKIEEEQSSDNKIKNSGVKELRKQAEKLEIPNFNKMIPDQLVKAIKEAKEAKKGE